MEKQLQDTALGGSYFFVQGWKLMLTPSLKRYIILPILINILIIGSAFYFIYQQIGGIINYLLSYFPSWLQWIGYALWPLIILSILLFFGYFFSTLANIVAAPFNSILSAKLEFLLTNKDTGNDSWHDIAKDAARSFKRELQNLAYYLPRLFGILLLFLIPIIGTILAPLFLFLFNSWMMSIQYHDYAFDNNKISFPTMRQSLQQERMNNIVFGILINICTMIPIINLFIMPAAVCGGTLLWVKKYRAQFMK